MAPGDLSDMKDLETVIDEGSQTSGDYTAYHYAMNAYQDAHFLKQKLSNFRQVRGSHHDAMHDVNKHRDAIKASTDAQHTHELVEKAMAELPNLRMRTMNGCTTELEERCCVVCDHLAQSMTSTVAEISSADWKPPGDVPALQASMALAKTLLTTAYQQLVDRT